MIEKFRTLQAGAPANRGRTRQEIQPIRNRTATTHEATVSRLATVSLETGLQSPSPESPTGRAGTPHYLGLEVGEAQHKPIDDLAYSLALPLR